MCIIRSLHIISGDTVRSISSPIVVLLSRKRSSISHQDVPFVDAAKQLVQPMGFAGLDRALHENLPASMVQIQQSYRLHHRRAAPRMLPRGLRVCGLIFRAIRHLSGSAVDRLDAVAAPSELAPGLAQDPSSPSTWLRKTRNVTSCEQNRRRVVFVQLETSSGGISSAGRMHISPRH